MDPIRPPQTGPVNDLDHDPDKWSPEVFVLHETMRRAPRAWTYLPAGRFLNSELRHGCTSEAILAAHDAYVAKFGGDAWKAFKDGEDGGQTVFNLLVHDIDGDGTPIRRPVAAMQTAASLLGEGVFSDLVAAGRTREQVTAVLLELTAPTAS